MRLGTRLSFLLISPILVLPGLGRAVEPHQVVARNAHRVLRKNVVRVRGRHYLAAGGSHFRSLWTRDAAFGMIYGLVPLAHRHGWARKTLHDHVSFLVNSTRGDGLVARYLVGEVPGGLGWIARRMRFNWDRSNWRVALVMKLRKLGLHKRAERVLPIKGPLSPKHTDEHNMLAIDSNILTLAAALSYVKATGDVAWWRKHEKQLVRIYRFYERHKREDGLIAQPPYSDWQDSVKRALPVKREAAPRTLVARAGRVLAGTKLGRWYQRRRWWKKVDPSERGVTFYTNLLYDRVSTALLTGKFVDRAAFGLDRAQLRKTRRQIEKAFKDKETGLYRSMLGMPQISLDGNLFALDMRFVRGARRKRHYERMKKVFAYRTDDGREGIGFNTTPRYPREWNHAAIEWSGLQGYHDRIQWSWLMGLSAKVATDMGDKKLASSVMSRLAASAQKRGTIFEVFEPGTRSALVPFKGKGTFPYHSERDFSWGSAFASYAARAMDASAADAPAAPAAR